MDARTVGTALAINKGRRRAGLSQKQLAAMIGVTQQAVSQWESGGDIGKEHWRAIFDIIGVDVAAHSMVVLGEQVLSGMRAAGQNALDDHRRKKNIAEAALKTFASSSADVVVRAANTDKEKSNVEPPHETGHIRYVPIISWVQAGDWEDSNCQTNPGYAEEWLATTETKNHNSFALRVKGDSMEPEFNDGDVIVVDPGKIPENGSYIVAKNGVDATFKQYVMDGSSVFLKPLNSRYPIKDMTGIEFRIVGVVVEKRKKY